MAIAKVILNGEVQMDVTSDTVAASNMLSGIVGTKNDGTKATGSIAKKTSESITISGASVIVPAGYYSSSASKSVGLGSAGTPTATKGTVSNHAVSVTPSVTNTTGYITGSTKTGTAVTVTASELASGNKEITQNGTGIDVVGYSTVSVDVPSGKQYTATITSTGNSSYAYVRYPNSTGTKYYTLGDSFQIQSGEIIQLHCSALRTDASIYINNERVAYSSSFAASYDYLVPNATDVEISLTYGNPSTIYLTEIRDTIEITSNGLHDVSEYDYASVNVSGGGISGVATGTLTVASDVSTTTKVTIVSTDKIGFIPTKFLFYKNEDTTTDKCIRMATYAQLGAEYVRTRSIYSTQNATCATGANYTDWTTSNSGYLYRSSSDIQISVSSSYILKAGTYTWWAME